jgi:tetratricopeptide (TPR) repeat protein
MLNDAIDRATGSQVSLREQTLKVTVIDDAVSPVVLELPPLGVLATLERLSIAGVDVPATVESLKQDVKAYIEERLERLLVKEERFLDSATYLTHVGDLAFFSGNLEEAKSFLERAVAQTESRVPRKKLAEVLFWAHEPDAAIAVLKGPGLAADADSITWQALILLRQNKIGEAEAMLRSAIERDNTNFRARMLIGCIDIFQNRFSSAIHNFRIAGSENRYTPALLSNMAIAYLMLRDHEKALGCLKVAIEESPYDEGLLVFFADLSARLGRPAQAVPLLKAHIEAANQSPTALDRLAHAHYMLRQYKDAISSLKSQSAIDLDSGVWNNLGLVYWNMGKADRAKESFLFGLKQVTGKRGRGILTNNFVKFLFENSQYQSLVNFVEPMLPGSSDIEFAILSPQSMLSYSMALVELGMPKRGVDTTRRLVGSLQRGSSDRLRALTNLSYLLESVTGERRDAADVAAQIQEELTGNASLTPLERLQAANNLIFSMLEAGNLEKARSLLPGISSGIHKLPHATATLGLYHFRKGDRSRGEELYEESIRMLPSGRERNRFRQKMYLELARCFAREGDAKSARRYYQRCTAIEGGYVTTAKVASAELSELVQA